MHTENPEGNRCGQENFSSQQYIFQLISSNRISLDMYYLQFSISLIGFSNIGITENITAFNSNTQKCVALLLS